MLGKFVGSEVRWTVVLVLYISILKNLHMNLHKMEKIHHKLQIRATESTHHLLIIVHRASNTNALPGTSVTISSEEDCCWYNASLC
jgi:hypothetical protein